VDHRSRRRRGGGCANTSRSTASSATWWSPTPSEFAGGDLEAAVGEEIVENAEVADFAVIAETDA
jgi:hypothetical protein